jgi:hypothetical protein
MTVTLVNAVTVSAFDGDCVTAGAAPTIASATTQLHCRIDLIIMKAS